MFKLSEENNHNFTLKYLLNWPYEKVCKTGECGKSLYHRELAKVMCLHKIRVEKISLFHLKKCAVNNI